MNQGKTFVKSHIKENFKKSANKKMAFYEESADNFVCRACLELNPENLFCLSQVYDKDITIKELFALVTGIKVMFNF